MLPFSPTDLESSRVLLSATWRGTFGQSGVRDNESGRENLDCAMQRKSKQTIQTCCTFGDESKHYSFLLIDHRAHLCPELPAVFAAYTPGSNDPELSVAAQRLFACDLVMKQQEGKLPSQRRGLDCQLVPTLSSLDLDVHVDTMTSSRMSG